MPIALQSKLLRVLETGEIEKIGSTRATKVDVRVMAATNKAIKELIEAGKFRADLYYRLKVVEIEMPPLRERPEDIHALAEYFLKRHVRQFGLREVKISGSAIDKLMRYSFPGNARELENILRNCLVRLNGNTIRPDDIEVGAAVAGAASPETSSLELANDAVFDALFSEIARHQPLPEGYDAFDVVERKLIIRALEYNKGNQSRASRFLGITRNTLRKRIQKYGLKTERDESGD
jgi:transcriptional regulator with GAF, ATPase, and Fis domain